MQRSCRKRRRSARWSTTNWTPRLPSSPASERVIVIDVIDVSQAASSDIVVHSAAVSCSTAPSLSRCHRLPWNFVESLHSSLCLFLSSCLAGSLADEKLPLGLHDSSSAFPSSIFYRGDFFNRFILLHSVEITGKMSSLVTILNFVFFENAVERLSVFYGQYVISLHLAVLHVVR